MEILSEDVACLAKKRKITLKYSFFIWVNASSTAFLRSFDIYFKTGGFYLSAHIEAFNLAIKFTIS